MALLFSYGTLQEARVQRALFGRVVEGTPDVLTGFVRGQVPVVDGDTLNADLPHYENAVVTGRPEDRIDGTALQVSDDDLARADDYESPADYVRVAVTLASGARAWVYVHGPSRPAE
jgi:gamma-glutamylcyclotransferase (GGCT)/AIG2-like uncharacterized protein YtfP